MARYVHRPNPVDAVRWDGDLNAVRALISAEDEAHRDTNSGALWVTQNRLGQREVFPVAMNHWLVRDDTGRLLGMSPRQFETSYDIVAA